MKIATYLRQSQDRSGEGLGIDRQREDVQRLCQSRGWTDITEFVDNDVSATTNKVRPQFTAMMKRVDAGEFNVICARHVDRLLRKLSELENVLERCEKTGTHIVTAADSVDTSSDAGRLIARILAAVGQQEVERKASRQRSAALQAAKQGRWTGGRRAFGYEADGVTIREDEAAQVRQGYQDVLGGESLGEVGRRWTAAGYTTPRGTVWNRSSVKDVLCNPRNCGLRRHRTRADRENMDTRSDPEAGIIGRAEWPALVDETVWRRTVRILCHPTRRKKMGAKGLLSGVARCGICEQTVVRGADRGRALYRCKSMKHISRKAAPIDQWVEEVAIAVLSKPEASRLWTATIDATHLMAEADLLRSRLVDLAEDYPKMTRDQWTAANDAVHARLAEVQQELDAAAPAPGLAAVATATDPRKAFKGLSVAQRRKIVDTVMDVVIHPPGKGARTFDPDTVTCTEKGKAK